MTRVLIGVPCQDQVMADFSFSLARLLMQSGDIAITLMEVRGSDVAWSRNEMAREAIAGDYTHLCFFDSDMGFPADTLRRLLAAGKPVVGASYIKRCAPYNLLGAYAERLEGDGLVEALELPAGCLLINTAVLRKMSWPWFQFEYGENVGERTGEDIYFCRKARSLGVKVWCDLKLTREIKHVGVKAYGVEDGIEYVRRTQGGTLAR